MPLKQTVNTNRSELARVATQSIDESIREIPGNRQIVIALCGGRSIGCLLELWLARPELISKHCWQRLQFFLVDERLVGLEHEDSNYRLLSELFFSSAVTQGLINNKQLHPFEFTQGREAEALANYSRKIDEMGGSFDVVVLGVGEDGHVAGVFPNGAAFDNDRAFVSFDNSPKPPSGRMSATSGLISQSSFGVGMFLGENKRVAWQRFKDPTISVVDCPAKLLASLPEAVVISDIVD